MPQASLISKVVIIILTASLAFPAFAQSGRTRPKVAQPNAPTNEPPPVINVPAAAAVAKQEQVGTTSRFVLRNGITVIINEHHSTPIAAMVARFKAGSVDEPWALSPPARLVERLILRGTIQRPGNRALSDLRALGASIEAGTAYDGTAYSIVVPSEKFKDALLINSDMLQNPAFETEAVRREVKLLSEKQRRAGPTLDVGFTNYSEAFSARTLPANQIDPNLLAVDNPSASSKARLFTMAFSGALQLTPDSYASITREKVEAFYRAHYRPDNLIISIAGDVSTFNTLIAVQQMFGSFGAKPEQPAAPEAKSQSSSKSKTASRTTPIASAQPQSSSAIEASAAEQTTGIKPWGATEQPKLRYAAERADISQPIVSVGFHVPGSDSKDSAAIEVLAALAGIGRGSSLNRTLVDGQMVTNRVESSYLSFSGTGLFVTQTWCAMGSREGPSIDKAESALFKELDRLRRETPGEVELVRAKSVLEKRFTDEDSSYLGRARVLARNEAAGLPLKASLDYRGRIRSVSGDDVRRIAATYLMLANTSIHEYEPISAEARTFDADSFAATVSAWVPGFGQPVESSVIRASDSSSFALIVQGSDRPAERQSMLESVQPLPVKDFSTLNGPRAFVREEHSQPTVTVAVLFQGGRLIEDASTSGTTELMLRAMLCGSPRRNLSQVAMELEQLGADVRIVVEPDLFGFMLSVLARNADRALKLLREFMEEPAFRDEDLPRARLGQLAAIRDARDSGVTRSRELLFQALFSNHSYTLPLHGREEVVAGLTTEKLRDWYARVVSRQLPLVIIVGDTDGSALVSSQIAQGFKRREVDSAIQVRTPQAAAGEKVDQRRLGQTFVAVGTPGPRAGSAELIAARVLESAMKGEGGRLQQQPGDNQDGLGAVSVGLDSMFVAGAIYACAVRVPENEQRMRSALVAEFDRTARGGLTPDELASARLLAGSSELALMQSQANHAFRYAQAVFYRQQASDVDNFPDLVMKVTPDDVKRLVSNYFKQSSISAGIVRGAPQQTPTPVQK
ncbi:MAG TPA: pitrilysin family protein [Blastocatellia bacterium]|nr:pitrilysin family protein [Blastocatellia bacterium]